MKQIVTLLFTCLLAQASTQSITDIDNTWRITELNWVTEVAYDFLLRIDGDTSINSHTYRTFVRSDNVENPDWYRIDMFIREDANGRVYVTHASGQEGVLYDFGMEIGDTLTLWNGFEATVKDIDYIETLSGEMKRQLRLRLVRTEPNGPYCSTGARWLEDIGDKSMLFNNYCPTEPIFNGLACFFKGDDLYYSKSPAYCLGSTATDDFTTSQLQIYPNPVRDILNIRGAAPIQSVSLSSTQGKRLLNSNAPGGDVSFDLSHLPPGMYLLQLNAGSHNWTQKLIKVD